MDNESSKPQNSISNIIKSFEKSFENYNIFSKYNFFKYNKTIFILFMIVALILLIRLYKCNTYNNKENFLSIRINDNTTIINKNNHLIDYYPLYNEDLKYRMNMTNEYFVKDTNKSYANFITNFAFIPLVFEVIQQKFTNNIKSSKTVLDLKNSELI